MQTHTTASGNNGSDHDLEELARLERRLFAHRHAATTIQSAGETSDPPEAAATHGEALATLEEEAHELLCSAETGALLCRLQARTQAGSLTESQAAQVRELSRRRSEELDVPADVQASFTRLVNEPQEVWARAKHAGDWESFEPYLDRVVVLRQRALLRKPPADPYETLLDEYERGTSRAFFDSFDPMPPIADACGAAFDVAPYTHYLTEKFSAIYGL